MSANLDSNVHEAQHGAVSRRSCREIVCGTCRDSQCAICDCKPVEHGVRRDCGLLKHMLTDREEDLAAAQEDT